MTIDMRPYKATPVDLSKGGRTKQSFRDDADPNKLMRQYSKSGDKQLLQQSTAIALQGDFSEVPDFFTSLLQVQAVQEEFDAMPSSIRNAMDNSPAKLMEFMSNPNNLEEARELGLVGPEEPSPSIPQPPVVAPVLEAPEPSETE